MDAESIAKEVAKQLRNLDSIAEANVVESQGGPIDIEVTTQGGKKYLVTVEEDET